MFAMGVISADPTARKLKDSASFFSAAAGRKLLVRVQASRIIPHTSSLTYRAVSINWGPFLECPYSKSHSPGQLSIQSDQAN